ncbi:hypothetical protein RND71_021868 [Anisodus tanguticus]|uniref:Small acidic protein-like domain-containing protein n=1 Tax=Anisodus tanguticus TaxID=243964 RepID=A0AAE1RVZ0_9SOLA|nr:hypothetical protein RND71_021868 [Anisodus tanguticus]
MAAINFLLFLGSRGEYVDEPSQTCFWYGSSTSSPFHLLHYIILNSMESDSKGEFRKLSNDAVNRKYRRRSPVVGGGSSSSEGSPVRKRSSSPIPSRKDDRRHKDDYLDRDSSRNRQGRSGESHRQRDNDHRSRDHPRDIDKYYRDRYEDLGHRSKNRERETSLFKDKDSSFDRVGSGRRYNNSSIDNNRSRESDRFKEYRDSRDRKSDRSPAYEESRSNRNESNSRKDSSVQRLKEADLDGEKYIKEERKNYEDRDKMFEHRNVIFGKGRESPAKKSKFSGMDQSSEQGKDGLNRASAVDGKLSLNSKQGQDPNSELALEQGVKDSDIDAAKIAAMKAAELVNGNLIGTGIMTTDQKKKLLWGNKKTTTNTEESTHHWDTSLFGDRERQEKFNKLMGVKGEVKTENKPVIHDAEKQEELQMDLEKQYTAGLRRRDGRTVGLGL